MKSNRLKLESVSSRYGAPMGRRSTYPANPGPAIKLRMERMRWVDGDYDTGGAYWGNSGGTHMYCAWNDDSEDTECRLFVRAASREEAKRLATEDIQENSPDDGTAVKFYR